MVVSAIANLTIDTNKPTPLAEGLTVNSAVATSYLEASAYR